jgi:hypothetical protein
VRLAAERERRPMSTTDPGKDTVFLVREDAEHCFLFDDPTVLYSSLFRQASKPDSGISSDDAIEILEGIIPERIRSI